MFSRVKGRYQNLAWYASPATTYCHLVQLDAELNALPTKAQEKLIVYPEDDALNAGHFFSLQDGNLLNLN